MSLWDTIKAFVGKIIDNPIKSSIVAFLIWRIMASNSEKKESLMCESYNIISSKDGKELIQDLSTKAFFIVSNGKATQVKSEVEGKKLLGENMTIKNRMEKLELANPSAQMRLNRLESLNKIKVGYFKENHKITEFETWWTTSDAEDREKVLLAIDVDENEAEIWAKQTAMTLPFMIYKLAEDYYMLNSDDFGGSTGASDFIEPRKNKMNRIKEDEKPVDTKPTYYQKVEK